MDKLGVHLLVATAFGCVCASADDAAGVMRVVSGTNGEATVEMPFAPFGDGTIPAFLSGAFLGDGGAGSDRLWRIASDGTSTNAVFASGEWIDPADGEASTLTATHGDMIVLASGDGAPFGFWLRGRVAPQAGWPFISGLSVDSDGGFAALAVATGGYPADVFTFDTGEETPDWTYLGRWPGYPHSFAWCDMSLAGMSNETARVYLVSDASRDTDGDGIPDALERHVYGTSPFLADTDGDGMPDGWETANGLDPLAPSDASADPDGDGVPNGDEYAHGGDPRLSEPDPRTRLPGLRAEFWRTVGKQATMPEFGKLLPSTLGALPCVDMPATPWCDGAAIGNYFACRLDGFVRIPADGRYTFHLASNAGAVMTFDGETLVSDPAAHSTRTRSASRNLARGFYPVSIAFYKNTGSESLVLEWEGPGLEREVVPASAFCHLPVAEILPTGYAHGLVFADSETSGALRAPLTGTYRLTASSAKGFRLWLDGTLLADCFSSRGNVSRAVNKDSKSIISRVD